MLELQAGVAALARPLQPDGFEGFTTMGVARRPSYLPALKPGNVGPAQEHRYSLAPGYRSGM